MQEIFSYTLFALRCLLWVWARNTISTPEVPNIKCNTSSVRVVWARDIMHIFLDPSCIHRGYILWYVFLCFVLFCCFRWGEGMGIGEEQY